MRSPEDDDLKATFRDDVIAMLIASGYHRARIESLNDYDRIVGGIAWALTRCDDVHVAADLLYEESEDQNIKLRTEQSEKIIDALRTVQCPFELSAHQLLGLDFATLKHLVQWLLRRLLARTNESANKRFSDWFVVSKKQKQSGKRPTWHQLNRPVTARQMKRFDTDKTFDLSLDAKCTLAEYANYSRAGDRINMKIEESTSATEFKETYYKKHVPTSIVREMIEMAVVDSVNDSAAGISQPEANLPEKVCDVNKRISEEGNLLETLNKKHKNLQERFLEATRKMEGTSESEIEQITDLIKSFQSTQSRAHELQSYLQHDMDSTKDCNDGSLQRVKGWEQNSEFDAQKQKVSEEYAEKTKQYGEVLREVLSLQFALDQMIGVNLSSHYRKRNMENLQNSASFTEEAKAAVVDYNVTVDILKFSSKITSFLNELEKSLMADPASHEYRDAFVSYMNDVRTQLGEYHWRAKQTQDKTIEEKSQLAETRSKIRQTERQVAKTSGEMKKLLQLNANLQQFLTELETSDQHK